MVDYCCCLLRGGSRLLLGRTNDHETGLGAGDAAADEEDAVLRAGGDDLEILHGAVVHAHVAGHPLVLPHAAGSETATNSARPAVHHGTVRLALTGEAVTLH